MKTDGLIPLKTQNHLVANVSDTGLLLIMGIFMHEVVSHQTGAASNGQPPPAFIGWVFGAIGLGMFRFLADMAALKFRAAWCLKHRRSRTFCMIVAAISCLEVPYGTALSALTFIALGRDSVAQLFKPTLP